MNSNKFNDVPPHDDETAAMVWIIDKYLQVCEWDSVVTCFNQYAATIATGDPIAYIECIRRALVAIINCQAGRQDLLLFLFLFLSIVFDPS
jgi:hypothetical protein